MAIPTGNLVARPRVIVGGAGLLLAMLAGTVSASGDWPMLAHDPARSGSTVTEIRPPFARKWYRLFPDEGLMSGVQPIVSAGKVFVGTMKGVLHAMDARTGRDVWTYTAPQAILHTCAAGGSAVVFGCADGRVYGLDANRGTLTWSIRTDAAVWNAPLIWDNLVLIGSRDGSLYAIDVERGDVRWKAATAGPLLSSPALDAKQNRAYIASEDMHVYAFDLSDGIQRWRSPKLPGVSFRGYHPVVAPDGSVMVTVTPTLSLDSFEPVLMDMVRNVFGDFASWRHNKEENERLREANFRRMAEPGSYEAQLDHIRKRLTSEPAYQTFFVLDPDTGRHKFVTPIVYAESMNGTGAPPLVAPDGKVVVKFQALLRSRYEHYSPFLNVGYLDTETGHITPIMDQSRTYGWHDSLLLVHDEQCQLAVAGRVLINAHQDNVNAMDLDTLQGYGEPFCRGVHEPQPGEAVGLWAMLLRNQTLPLGKEWLARGTAVYGGGSVIDTAVSIAGDSFYYIPTHEISAGAAVIAFRMDTKGNAGQKPESPSARLTDSEWDKIKDLPWDWDTLQMPRLRHVLEALPGAVPGTRAAPLSEQAAERVSRITDSELDRFIWEVPAVKVADGEGPEGLKARLATCMKELISQRWQPLIFPPGKHPREAYRVFSDPTETLLTLALAYPHVSEDLQHAIVRYVDRMREAGGPLDGPVGRDTVDPADGAVRSYYDIAPQKLFRVLDDVVRNEVARLYPLWLWAHVSGDWKHIERNWNHLRGLADRPANKMEEDCRNGYLAGLIAYCRIAAHMDDQEALADGLNRTRSALRERLAYELAHSNGGLISQVPVSRSIFARWRHLTPEAGRFLAACAGPTHRHLMDVYVDHHRPTWYLAWGVESMWRNESAFAFPTMADEIFAVRAWVLGESPEKLARFLDLPWCKADLFYIRKLVLCIEAHAPIAWETLAADAAAG
ncbi:MAG: PQQ-binding-like beta-propeller repeat protein [Sedimentisphaerales bacterium]|jgi:outer membrane protein assembly factor BamB|nr:PQQ-binding-like beta-propeller repeat protein [Sedimentisphaerales bacterium]HNY79104.1 PQQ-binding-like beta-propeller repeat protein [Sedimentisphaerales bacterium]HOC64404.1 PQQ-binding-like beta-propeller repeat protein [Sedimentisphaerales bacterium]HOH65160.1 PQQ-binding-like beta-propeller repeat protein [Sedimentisphaerales bacterium]HPY48244.1 PQQ-binding-like beta-propeller repeat protein [Sedimentisphaerales bacterium]